MSCALGRELVYERSCQPSSMKKSSDYASIVSSCSSTLEHFLSIPKPGFVERALLSLADSDPLWFLKDSLVYVSPESARIDAEPCSGFTRRVVSIRVRHGTPWVVKMLHASSGACEQDAPCVARGLCVERVESALH